MPRPKPGTPEYEEMARQAMAQRGVTPAPAPLPAQPTYQPPAPSQTPIWSPGMPRPKPGTPEYEEMARQAMAQRGVAPPPGPSQPQSSPASFGSPPPSQPPAWSPGMPRPKPGTPEYEEMARQAMAQRGVTPAPAPPPSQAQPAASSPTGMPPWEEIIGVPPGTRRPKPGTPEYEELARRMINLQRGFREVR